MHTTCPATGASPPERQSHAGAAAILCLSLLAGLPLHAQTVPDAGMLLRNTERSLEPRSPATADKLYPPELRIPADDATPLSFQSFQVRGLRQLKPEDVLPRLSRYQGQTLQTRELPAITHAIEAAYQAAGLRARVYIPRQDLGRSVLIIQVIELPLSGQP